MKNIVSPKKFEISPKKFEILWDTRKLKFRILNKINNTINCGWDDLKIINLGGDRIIKFTKQIDDNSCWYCLLNNASNFLDMNTYNSIEEVFNLINKTRIIKNKEPLSRNQNLPTWDINNYFYENGYDVTTYSGYFEISDIENHIESNDFSLLYLTSYNHYKWIVFYEKDKYYLLDSMKDGPIIINTKIVLNMIQESLGLKWSRYDLVGLVCKRKKNFKIII